MPIWLQAGQREETNGGPGCDVVGATFSLLVPSTNQQKLRSRVIYGYNTVWGENTTHGSVRTRPAVERRAKCELKGLKRIIFVPQNHRKIPRTTVSVAITRSRRPYRITFRVVKGNMKSR